MKIKILSVQNEDKGKYNQLTVNFKNLDTGVVMATKVMSFTVPDVYAQLKDAVVDSIFDVQSVKNDKGFWEWKSVGPLKEAEMVASKKASFAAKANTAGRDFETSAERHVRQKLIVRQSSLSAAVETLKAMGEPFLQADVVRDAEYFERWVYRNTPFDDGIKDKTPAKSIEDIDDDIPY